MIFKLLTLQHASGRPARVWAEGLGDDNDKEAACLCLCFWDSGCPGPKHVPWSPGVSGERRDVV